MINATAIKPRKIPPTANFVRILVTSDSIPIAASIVRYIAQQIAGKWHALELQMISMTLSSRLLGFFKVKLVAKATRARWQLPELFKTAQIIPRFYREGMDPLSGMVTIIMDSGDSASYSKDCLKWCMQMHDISAHAEKVVSLEDVMESTVIAMGPISAMAGTCS